MEMLRNEVRYTTMQRSIPANLTLADHKVGPPSFFGAGEYAKDGLIAVTEYLGRTPWFYRMVDMIADAMTDAPVPSRFGALPAADAETNGDYLQALVRIATMTGDQRFLDWARRIGDAYIEEVLPAAVAFPATSGTSSALGRAAAPVARSRQRNDRRPGDAVRARASSARRAPRAIVPSFSACWTACSHLPTRTACSTTKSTSTRCSRSIATLSDNWGYVYGAVYSYYMVTGDTRYRDAVRRCCGLPRYRKVVWGRATLRRCRSGRSTGTPTRSRARSISFPASGAGSLRLDRIGNGGDARDATRRRPHRGLVRRRQLQSHGPALCLYASQGVRPTAGSPESASAPFATARGCVCTL